MDVRTKLSLKSYTTMRLGGEARFVAEATTVDDVRTIYVNAKKQGLPIFVLGGGSNVIARDEGYDGIILLNRIKGFQIISEDERMVVVKIGAGETWDDIVAKTVDMGLTGIEAMSGIPGTAGAAPVQNIGAYGQELSDTLVSLEAFDAQTEQLVTLDAESCQFSYRHSIFRDKLKGRYCIVTITLKLYRGVMKPPYYPSLQSYLEQSRQQPLIPRDIREAVLAIRTEKLPDPSERPNSGSFFKNSLIEPWQLEQLRQDYPDMPCYDMPENICKVPAGWLIDRVGLRGKLLCGMRIYDKNALVLINESATSYADLAAAREEIIQTVYDQFHIKIEQEPLEIV